MGSQPATPGKNASINASRPTSRGYIAAYTYATHEPNVVPNHVHTPKTHRW